MQIILGIDPGTLCTGFGIIHHSAHEYKLIHHGTIRTKSGDAQELRYLKIYEGLEELVEKYRPDCISVETQFVYKNVQSALKIGMARGLVLLLAAKNAIPIYEYAPKKAKLAVVGSGSASKHQVKHMIRLILNLPKDIESEDAADALSLAICHAHNSRRLHV